MHRLPAGVLAPGALAAASLLAVVSALVGPAWLTAVLLVVAVLADVWTCVAAPVRDAQLEQAALGRTTRILTRGLVVALAGIGVWSTGAAVAFVVVLGVLVAGHGVEVLCARQLDKPHARPVLVRNIDVPAPRRVLGMGRHRWRTEVPAELVVLVPSALPALFAPWAVLLLGAVAAALLVVQVAGPVTEVLRNRQSQVPPGELSPKLRPLQDWLDRERPEVVLHLTGNRDAAYQVDVWLRTLESLDQRVLVLLRNDELFEAVKATTLPVASVTGARDVLALDFSSVTVALFPTHVGSNLHLLRLPSLMGAFIGHGDSDKSASINPFGRVYDELWVAGEAGADRWRRAGLGIREEQLVAVGRPQIAAVEAAVPRPSDRRPVLLYAPTWEGWNPSQEYSSTGAVGERVVAAALAHPAGFRVVYKPHPLLGARDPKVRGAHARIVRMLRDAGAGHEVVQGGASRDLFDCFNEADALVTDVSSVVTDFLASEKPYGVYDFTGLGRAAFVEAYPSAGAATVVAADGTGVDELLDVVARARPDERAAARSELATYLLGPPSARSREPFRQAVTALAERARTERAAHRAARTAPDLA